LHTVSQGELRKDARHAIIDALAQRCGASR
jgi:hypothetical protein